MAGYLCHSSWSVPIGILHEHGDVQKQYRKCDGGVSYFDSNITTASHQQFNDRDVSSIACEMERGISLSGVNAVIIRMHSSGSIVKYIAFQDARLRLEH